MQAAVECREECAAENSKSRPDLTRPKDVNYQNKSKPEIQAQNAQNAWEKSKIAREKSKECSVMPSPNPRRISKRKTCAIQPAFNA